MTANERRLEAVEDLPAVDGRVPGRRGRATRRKLLDETRAALTHEAYRDIKVVDIAKAAGTSPATFYQYFPDVEHAVLVLAEDVARETGSLTELVDGAWSGRAGIDTARDLVRGFLDLWEEHRPVLRVVELSTEEGDLRFQNLRVRALNEVTRALADVVGRFQRDGRVPGLDPMAVAGSLVAMLAHTAAHLYGFEFWGIRRDDLEESLTRTLYWSVTGQTP